jgi:hypothetical protein
MTKGFRDGDCFFINHNTARHLWPLHRTKLLPRHESTLASHEIARFISTPVPKKSSMNFQEIPKLLSALLADLRKAVKKKPDAAGLDQLIECVDAISEAQQAYLKHIEGLAKWVEHREKMLSDRSGGSKMEGTGLPFPHALGTLPEGSAGMSGVVEAARNSFDWSAFRALLTMEITKMTALELELRAVLVLRDIQLEAGLRSVAENIRRWTARINNLQTPIDIPF